MWNWLRRQHTPCAWYEKYATGNYLERKDYLSLVQSMTEEEFSDIPDYLKLGLDKISIVDVCEFWIYKYQYGRWPSLEEAKILIEKNREYYEDRRY